MNQTNAPRVNALFRGLQILELLSGQQRRWSTSEISRKLKIPKSSASYLLHTLHSRGYLRRESDGGYRLSMKMLALGSLGLHGIQAREVALPILRRVVEETQITGHLGVLDGNGVVYVERVPSPGFIQIDTWVGRRMPLHSSSSGKTLLAYLAPQIADPLLDSMELTRFTPHTITTLPKLRQELKKIRENGYAIDDEENTAGVRCVAAPIFDRSGAVAAALSLTGPVQHLTEDRLPRIAEKAKEAARQMTSALGGQMQPPARRN
ncbi:MAG: IclR family transcriptional regulator [Acidobacteria bacterium]|nr:IclR family transcriptional regulator [Acidobacteriota bacterium]